MSKYKCPDCKKEIELYKETLILAGRQWKAKESFCEECNAYMTRDKSDCPTLQDFKEEGLNIIRTEPTLNKK